MRRWRMVVKESSSMMPTRRRRRAADDGQHFERDLRMLHAECVKILARDEGDLRIFNRHGRGGETAAVEDRQLGDRLAGLVHGQHLLAAVDRGFEDADLAAAMMCRPWQGSSSENSNSPALKCLRTVRAASN